MDKKYYFLAGFHRTGNTLLSSILNQNPDFHSSALSPVAEYLYAMQDLAMNNFHINNTQDIQGSHNALQKFMDNYYEHIDKPVIFDRQKTWGMPRNFYNIQTYITDKPKIIFTTRPLLEILASLIIIYGDRLNKFMEDNKWQWKSHLTENDNKCDYLMSPLFELDYLFSTYTTMKNFPEAFCLIEYDDLINNPNETLRKIYDFLGEEYYEHDFNNIQRVETYTEVNLNMPINMHEVRPKLEKKDLDITTILSNYAINKYKQH
jgi:sulfotransferase